MNEIQQNDVVEITDQIDATEQVEEIELDEAEQDDLEVQVELSLEQIVDQIVDAMKLSEWTMYQIHKALNKVLEVVDIKVQDKNGEQIAYRVRPQMIYNYNRNAMVARNEQGKGIKLTGNATTAQTTAFIKRFVAKQLAK